MFKGEKVMPLIQRTLYLPTSKVVVVLFCGVLLLPVDMVLSRKLMEH